MEKKKWQKRLLILVIILASLLPLLLVLEVIGVLIMIFAPNSTSAEFIMNVQDIFM